jgi:hypothetical protein
VLHEGLRSTCLVSAPLSLRLPAVSPPIFRDNRSSLALLFAEFRPFDSSCAAERLLLFLLGSRIAGTWLHFEVGPPFSSLPAISASRQRHGHVLPRSHDDSRDSSHVISPSEPEPSTNVTSTSCLPISYTSTTTTSSTRLRNISAQARPIARARVRHSVPTWSSQPKICRSFSLGKVATPSCDAISCSHALPVA